MKPTLPLRCALASNAAFSLTCGLLMLFRPGQVGDWLGQDPRLVIQAVGLGLVFLLVSCFIRQHVRVLRLGAHC